MYSTYDINVQITLRLGAGVPRLSGIVGELSRRADVAPLDISLMGLHGSRWLKPSGWMRVDRECRMEGKNLEY